MEPHSGKIKGTGNMKEFKKEIKKNESVMSVHVECAIVHSTRWFY